MDKASEGLLTNLGVGAGILLVVALVFDVMRFFFPKNYYYRELASNLPELNDYDGTPMYAPPRPPWYPFAWLKPVIMYPESKLKKTHGLDAAMYVRFLRIQALLFTILSVYVLLVLFPLYATAVNSAPRLKPIVNSANSTNSTNSTKSTNSTNSNITGIEIFSLSNLRVRDGRLWGTLISEIVVLALVFIFVLRELTVHASYRLAYRADSNRNPSNYAIIVMDIPPESRTPEQIRRFFVRCFPGDVAGVHQVRDAETLFNAKSRVVSAMGARERAQYLLLEASTKYPDRDLAPYEDKIIAALRNQQEAEQTLVDMRDDLDMYAPITHAAIVVFYTKRAATLACCTPLWKASNAWVVERAAEPRAVNWNRLEISSHTSLGRSLTTMLVLFAFVAFWFFPITAIQGLSNLEKVSRLGPFKFLEPLVKSKDETVVRFVKFAENVLPPLILFILLQLIPMLFRFIIGFERIPHKGSVEGKVRSYLFLFYVMSNFVFVVITGSVLEEVEKLVKNPNEIFNLLSTTVPGQATFLMKYVLINSFLGSAMGLLNIGRLLIRPILVLFAKTTRQKRGADAIFSMYPLFKMHALAQMISLISLIYSTIAPLICLVAVVYFSIAYVCTKHTIMYSHRPFFESGGHLYPGSWYAVLAGLYFHQLVLVGIFSLKRAVAQAVIAAGMLLLTIGFTVYCLKRFYKIARNGSLIDQLDADDKTGLIDKIPPHFVDWYIHPGLTPIENKEDLTGLPRALRDPAPKSETSKYFPSNETVASRTLKRNFESK